VRYLQAPPKPQMLNPGGTLNWNIKSNYVDLAVSKFSNLFKILREGPISPLDQRSKSTQLIEAKSQSSSDYLFSKFEE
jgi:hypothetical protein